MAVDTTVFAADIPAGTYNVGDVVPLVNIAGPANVRSGRGKAILKQIIGLRLDNVLPFWEIHVKNSDWIDEVISYAGQLTALTSLDERSGVVQNGCNEDLAQNSGWQAYAVCVLAGTSTSADSVFALIDIDYPQVSAIVDPSQLVGEPTSIKYTKSTVPTYAPGSALAAQWSVENVDYFKAGYEYCLQGIEGIATAATLGGFLAYASAAGMGGLQRIVPLNINVTAIRPKIRYSSKLVKGPMDVKLMMFHTTAGTSDVFVLNDYVKRKV